MKSWWPGFLHKSDLYGWVNQKVGPKLQKANGWGLIFKFLSANCFSDVDDNALITRTPLKRGI
jgi:hypothetical protein